MRDEAQAVFAIAFGLVDGIGPATARRLLSSFNGPQEVISASKSALRATGVHAKVVDGLKDDRLLPFAKEEYRKLKKLGGGVDLLGTEGYPERLSKCIDPPILLYSKGSADLNHPRTVAIVGTRKVTSYGRMICEMLIEGLSAYNVQIISGLAFGVDICAHRAALKHEVPTIGCLAHGLDRIYPGIHKPEADRMMQEQGALVTEYSFDTRPIRKNFPSRNRIIAGLADATVVIESAEKGGSIITARIASSYHREVFAVPGSLLNDQSIGTNALIRNMEAQILLDAKQLAREMGWEAKSSAVQQLSLNLELPEDQRKVCEVLQEHGTRHIDLLTHDLQDQVDQLAAVLLQMELSGIIRLLPGQRFCLA